MASKLGLKNLLGPDCPEKDLAYGLIIARAVSAGVETGHHPLVGGYHAWRRPGH